jgi:hypothetical protein
MVPDIFLYKMILTSSAFISAERASVAYIEAAVLALYTDATLPALEGGDALPSVSPDIAASKKCLAALLLAWKSEQSTRLPRPPSAPRLALSRAGDLAEPRLSGELTYLGLSAFS